MGNQSRTTQLLPGVQPKSQRQAGRRTQRRLGGDSEVVCLSCLQERTILESVVFLCFVLGVLRFVERWEHKRQHVGANVTQDSAVKRTNNDQPCEREVSQSTKAAQKGKRAIVRSVKKARTVEQAREQCRPRLESLSRP